MTEFAAPRPRVLPARASPDWVVASYVWLVPFGLFLLALVARVFFVWRESFDGLYGQDAYAYYDYAKQMYAALSHAELPPPFWWPFGYPALLSFGFLFLGTSVRSAQIITLISGAMVAPLTFLLSREAIRGPRANLAGLVAGGIVALGGQLIQSSVVIMADAPALMWATLSAWLLIRYRRSGGIAVLSLSAVAMSLALISRWENLGFALVWLAATLVPGPARGRHGEDTSNQLDLRKSGPALLIALGLAAIVVLPQVIYQVESASPLAGQSWLEGWSLANALASSFDTIDGHFDYALPVAVFYAQVFFHPAFLFPLLTPFLFVGAWLFLEQIRSQASTSILLLGWILLMYVFLAGIPYENFRFGLGFIVPVAVLAGKGAAWAWGKLSEEQLPYPRAVGVKHLKRAYSIAPLALVGISLVGTVLWESRVLQPVLAEKEMELAAARWVSARLPSSSSLYSFGVTEALQAYSTLDVKDLSEESPAQIAADAQTEARRYLFVDVSNIETQWRGRSLDQNLSALRGRLGLQEMGRLGRFTLFYIGAGQ